MSYPFGVVGGVVHDVISLAAPTTILDNWQQGKTEQDFEIIAKKIDKNSSSAKDKAKTEGKAPILETFDYEIQDRFYGVLVGLAKRIMIDGIMLDGIDLILLTMEYI